MSIVSQILKAWRSNRGSRLFEHLSDNGISHNALKTVYVIYIIRFNRTRKLSYLVVDLSLSDYSKYEHENQRKPMKDFQYKSNPSINHSNPVTIRITKRLFPTKARNQTKDGLEIVSAVLDYYFPLEEAYIGQG